MRVLSGIQPSGRLHLGNYLGAMAQYLELQQEHECFFFIANYHSMTTVQDAALLRANTLNVAIDYLAIGLDPTKANLFRQSDVPEVTELAWILATVTGKGLLDRATSYKDKVAQGIAPSMGLFGYPLLMAADILIFHTDIVPVGKDQEQHVEMARDMAGHFNAKHCCDALKIPQARLGQAPIVPGVDGQKMSKSYGNAVDLFDTAKKTRKRIMGIVTDSTPVEDPKDPDKCTVFSLYKLFADEPAVTELAQRYRAGGLGYGEAKKALAEVVESLLAPARQRREELAGDLDYVEDVLSTCGQRARTVARNVMEGVREACGLVVAKGVHR